MTEEVLHSRPVDDIQEKAAVKISIKLFKFCFSREEQFSFTKVFRIGTTEQFFVSHFEWPATHNMV